MECRTKVLLPGGTGQISAACSARAMAFEDRVARVSIGDYHSYNVRQACASTTTRAWRAQIDGYSEANGVWYAGTQRQENNLNCNYP